MYADPNEEKRRYDIFVHTFQTIIGHNVKYERGEVTYKMGLPITADMSLEETHWFRGMRMRKNVSPTHVAN